ncbi:P-loop containing nucleoside triphosphate hydrolase protein [Lophiotrema nucula]|uniref:P-loop containing nucleoside triphosphate hydrolase protein n=1 Tax=Lophiotrema nucula TaxID=690887 RepID=A0A6A5Z5Y3_9PLEO|nr:P-loop containing nucleoside triphosphate hydrolase protein [Lophiotrema nucula]
MANISTFGTAGVNGHGTLINGSITFDQRVEVGSSSSPSLSQPRSDPISTIPFSRDRHFVGRRHLHRQLKEACARSPRVALVGFGGVGKSQIAIRYGQDVHEGSPNKSYANKAPPKTWVFWVHASTQAKFETAYRGIAEKLRLPGLDNSGTNVLKLVKSWLEDSNNGRWMMILDSADHMNVFFPESGKANDRKTANEPPLASFLPDLPHGTIIITTRNRAVPGRLANYAGHSDVEYVDIPVMDEKEAERLFSNLLHTKVKQKCNNEDIRKLIGHLKCLPLAISQAAAYINRPTNTLSVKQYTERFQMNEISRERLLRNAEVSRSTVFATWQVTFQEIEAKNPSAAELLSFMSFFNPQDIPFSALMRLRAPTVIVQDEDGEVGTRSATYSMILSLIIQSGRWFVSLISGGMREVEESAVDYDLYEDINVLSNYSLIKSLDSSESFEMHPLVQFSIERWLRHQKGYGRMYARFLEVMAEQFPTGEADTWPECQKLVPHIERILKDGPLTTDGNGKNRSILLVNASRYLWRKGDYKAAVKVARDAYTLKAKCYGELSSPTLTTMVILADIQQEMEQYSEAVRLYRLALEGTTKHFGGSHPRTLAAVHGLAETLKRKATSKKSSLGGAEDM